MKHPRSLLRRAVGAAAAFVVASAALVNVGNSPARADQNTDIRFGPVTATDVIQDGLEVPDPATIKLVEVQAGPDGTGETERVVATANPAATDLVWGAPKFSSEDNRVAIGGDDTSATFTVVDQITLPVLLTNTAPRTTGGVATPPAASPTPDPKDPATTGPVEPADPGADDPVDSAESAKATPQPQQTPPASTPRAVPAPIKPGLLRTGHNGCVRQDEKGSGSGESRP